MPDPNHIEVLRAGPAAWNAWRRRERIECPELADLNLGTQVDLSSRPRTLQAFDGFDFSGSNLNRISGRNCTFGHCSFDNAAVNMADLCYSLFVDCTFRGASLRLARLGSASFEGCIFEHTDLSYSSAEETAFRSCNILSSTLDHASLVKTDFSGSVLIDVSAYGISAWDLVLDGTDQIGIRIPLGESTLSTDSIELAQFIHLLLRNSNLRQVIDTITSRVVLILGRFTDARKEILNELRRRLSLRGYVAVLFDFDGPQSRNLTETVSTIAHLSRFVVVDLSDPRSVPHELSQLIPSLPSVPFQPLIQAGEKPYGMFEHWRAFPWVLPLIEYEHSDLARIVDHAIGACEGRLAAPQSQ